MDLTKKFENLIQYEGNNRIVFLNPENNHWARMSKQYYTAICQDLEKKEQLIEKFHNDFDLFGGGTETSNIRSIYFSVTNKCNLQCSFCTMNSGPDVSTEEDLTLDEIQKMLIPKLKEISPKKIIITGGEPVMRKDILKILEVFAEAFGKERVLLQTNGLLLTEKFIDEVKEYVSTVEISIENIFENITLLLRMKKIFRRIRKNNLTLSLSFVLDEDSEPYFRDAADLCEEYEGILTLRIVTLVGRAIDSGRYQREESQEIEMVQKYYHYFSYLLEKDYLDDRFILGYLDNLQPKKSCGAFGKILSIFSDGTTYMCGNFKESDYSMGNIRSKTMAEIVENLDQKMLDEEMRNRFLVSQNLVCQTCPENYFCPGPCIAEVAENGGVMEKVDSKCLSKRAMIHFNLFYYDRRKSNKDNFQALTDFLREVIDEKITFS
ncbi:radical SAM/SPASM domain-containing protein [uncultured Vagococcus sp.]|uniref:radical SAM/SPASM domain-containing protein n=1 Tax=uncultured Vagococcus sp. TaxID=189676 RepID=UPI0028D49101|nr:radical SAM protein [uncultured Vagococcus sp.]